MASIVVIVSVVRLRMIRRRRSSMASDDSGVLQAWHPAIRPIAPDVAKALSHWYHVTYEPTALVKSWRGEANVWYIRHSDDGDPADHGTGHKQADW